MARVLAASIRRMKVLGVGAVLATVMVWSAGCESSQPTTRPLSVSERQDRALKDPMGYRPDFGEDRVNGGVSGGGIGDLDKKGLERDLKSVFNP